MAKRRQRKRQMASARARTRVSPRGNGRAAVREAEAIVKGSTSHGFRATEEGVKKVWKLIRENNIQVVDLKFNDLPGLWQHFTIPISEIEQNPNKGIWVDASGSTAPPSAGSRRSRNRI